VSKVVWIYYMDLAKLSCEISFKHLYIKYFFCFLYIYIYIYRKVIQKYLVLGSGFFIGKWYFDTVFCLTSVWHSDVACTVPRDNGKKNTVLFGISPLRHMCVFQNYKQRTTYLNWANHLVFSALRHVCVPKLQLHTTNHLFELS